MAEFQRGTLYVFRDGPVTVFFAGILGLFIAVGVGTTIQKLVPFGGYGARHTSLEDSVFKSGSVFGRDLVYTIDRHVVEDGRRWAIVSSVSPGASGKGSITLRSSTPALLTLPQGSIFQFSAPSYQYSGLSYGAGFLQVIDRAEE